MTNQLAIIDPYIRASLTEKQEYIRTLAGAGDLLPKSLLGPRIPNPNGGPPTQAVELGKIFLIAETGSMLGIHPMAALNSIYVVDGKPSLSANLLSALVRKVGHKLRVSTRGSVAGGDFVATAELIRSDDPDFTFSVEWTMDRAARAGLTSKDVWKKYPEAMCKSRAITEVVREGAPDVTTFPAYTPEELGAQVTEEGEPIEMQQVPDRQPPSATGEWVSQGGTRQSPAPEQPPIVPREQPPIADEQTGETEDDTPNYSKMLAEVTTYRESVDLYRLAESRGDLKLGITVGRQRNPRPLEDQIKEIGLKLKEAEEIAARARAEREQMEAAGQVTDDDGDVVQGELMPDDDTPMAMGDQ